MSRRNGSTSRLRVLLDSSYLLPIFGISVRGIEPADLLKLRELAIQNVLSLYYSEFSLIEILGKIAREAERRLASIETLIARVDEALRAITESEYLSPVDTPREALILALKLRLLGHNDMIDNILYATAASLGLAFLSLDETLRGFLEEQGITGSIVVSHEELFRMIK